MAGNTTNITIGKVSGNCNTANEMIFHNCDTGTPASIQQRQLEVAPALNPIESSASFLSSTLPHCDSGQDSVRHTEHDLQLPTPVADSTSDGGAETTEREREQQEILHAPVTVEESIGYNLCSRRDTGTPASIQQRQLEVAPALNPIESSASFLSSTLLHCDSGQDSVRHTEHDLQLPTPVADSTSDGGAETTEREREQQEILHAPVTVEESSGYNLCSRRDTGTPASIQQRQLEVAPVLNPIESSASFLSSTLLHCDSGQDSVRHTEHDLQLPTPVADSTSDGGAETTEREREQQEILHAPVTVEESSGYNLCSRRADCENQGAESSPIMMQELKEIDENTDDDAASHNGNPGAMDGEMITPGCSLDGLYKSHST